MSNQGDSGKPFDVNQLQWALRHGQKIDGLENLIQSNQPILLPDNNVESHPATENSSIENTVETIVLEKEIGQLELFVKQELVTLRNEISIVSKSLQSLDKQLQQNDIMFRQEAALVTAKLEALQNMESNQEDILITQWREKNEEYQKQLSEEVSYIQYVVEEIATRPYNIEAQQKLRENFFIREIKSLKDEIASVCRRCKSREKRGMMADEEQVYKNKRRRH